MSIIFEPVTVVILLIAVAAVLYYYRYNLLTGAKVRSYQATEVISHSQLKTEANIECPSCGRTMEAGYLVGPQGIYWTKNAQLSGFFASRGMLIPGAEPMGFSSILRGPARIQNLKAYRCQRCNIVQVNLDEQQPVEF
ncbi:MAG: PF20097 family protein [Candidatus Bathyarchaeia archaeon]